MTFLSLSVFGVTYYQNTNIPVSVTNNNTIITLNNITNYNYFNVTNNITNTIYFSTINNFTNNFTNYFSVVLENNITTNNSYFIYFTNNITNEINNVINITNNLTTQQTFYINYTEIRNVFDVGVGYYVYNNSGYLDVNETKLNNTINAITSIYNDTSLINTINQTLSSNVSDIYSTFLRYAQNPYLYVTSQTVNFNESNMNDTVLLVCSVYDDTLSINSINANISSLNTSLINALTNNISTLNTNLGTTISSNISLLNTSLINALTNNISTLNTNLGIAINNNISTLNNSLINAINENASAKVNLSANWDNSGYNITASFFFGNINYSYIQNVPLPSTFNDAIWNITGSNYLINVSNVLNINETKINSTINARVSAFNLTSYVPYSNLTLIGYNMTLYNLNVTNFILANNINSSYIYSTGLDISLEANYTSRYMFPNATLIVTGNQDNYVQSVFQNKNNGNSASFDIVILNNLGNDTNYYLDLGKNSNTFNNSVYTLTKANDGYLIDVDGDLVLGTATANKNIIFGTGGWTKDKLRMNLSDTQLYLNNSVSLRSKDIVTNNITFNAITSPTNSSMYNNGTALIIVGHSGKNRIIIP